MTCEFCQAMDGRFQAQRECCQVRLLAGAPAPHRKGVYERLQQVAGATAVAELKEKVSAEYQRQLSVRAARQAAADAEAQRQWAARAAAARQATGALLKTMKEAQMHIHPLDRAGSVSTTMAVA